MLSGPDQLSTTLAALSDPTRRAILARLAAGEATVTELAAPFAMSMPAVSRHLKVLEHAGLITRGRQAQWRPCRITAAPLKDVADWLAHYQRFWTESLDRLGDYLRDMQREE
jgi:DNA-binding transcriptional ArsR family regulator